MDRKPFALLALVFLAFPAMTPAIRPASPPVAASDISAPIQIPAEFSDVGIIVPVMVKGRRLDFVLDSGASRVSIDQSVAAQLGLGAPDYRKSSGKGADWSRGHSEIAEISVGSYVQKNVDVLTVDFQHENMDKRVVGLLGCQFFTGHRVDINFKDKTVTLLPEDGAPLDPKIWSPLDIDTRANVPLTHAQFNAVDGRFIIDTGSFKTILYEHYFEHFHPKGQAVVQGQVVGITNHERDFKMFTFDRFDFGPLAFGEAQVTVAYGPEYETTAYDGLIGRDILSNFDIVFDYRHAKVYLKSFVS